jgi:hypothetical protein
MTKAIGSGRMDKSNWQRQNRQKQLATAAEYTNIIGRCVSELAEKTKANWDGPKDWQNRKKPLAGGPCDQQIRQNLLEDVEDGPWDVKNMVIFGSPPSPHPAFSTSTIAYP